jgi:carbon storage regulator
MLILERRIDEYILIGDDIIITVTEIKGNRVKLGISAPADIPIVRDDTVKATGPVRSSSTRRTMQRHHQ